MRVPTLVPRRIVPLLVLAAAALAQPAVSAAQVERARIDWDTDATDIDLHVWDEAGTHAFYGDRTAIPEGEVSEDVTTGSGPEFFRTATNDGRRFTYGLCYFGSSGSSPATVATVTLTDPDGSRRTATYNLPEPGVGVIIGTSPRNQPTAPGSEGGGCSRIIQPPGGVEPEPGGGGGGGLNPDGTIGGPTAPPPVRGQSVVTRELRGEVFVRFPASAATFRDDGPRAVFAQAGFIPLRQAANVPIGTLVEATRGTPRPPAAEGARRSNPTTAVVSAGQFPVLQSRGRTATTEMRMFGGDFAACGSRKPGARAAGSSRRVRRLRANGRGRFRTRGRYSTATVRGTNWTVEDRCNGTLTRVSTGTVVVRDLVRRRTVRLRARQTYIARRR